MPLSKADYVEWLNELGVPYDDTRSEGGRIPDHAKYGEWTRRNDPIAFNIGYREWVDNERYNASRVKFPRGCAPV